MSLLTLESSTYTLHLIIEPTIQNTTLVYKFFLFMLSGQFRFSCLFVRACALPNSLTVLFFFLSLSFFCSIFFFISRELLYFLNQSYSNHSHPNTTIYQALFIIQILWLIDFTGLPYLWICFILTFFFPPSSFQLFQDLLVNIIWLRSFLPLPPVICFFHSSCQININSNYLEKINTTKMTNCPCQRQTILTEVHGSF